LIDVETDCLERASLLVDTGFVTVKLRVVLLEPVDELVVVPPEVAGTADELPPPPLQPLSRAIAVVSAKRRTFSNPETVLLIKRLSLTPPRTPENPRHWDPWRPLRLIIPDFGGRRLQ